MEKLYTSYCPNKTTGSFIDINNTIKINIINTTKKAFTKDLSKWENKYKNKKANTTYINAFNITKILLH
jgi:hypothetical protein